jgi:preprotein translocase subunit SecG
MSLFFFLTVVQALVAAALVGVILMQRSEGGGLGVGGNPSGLMSARGAADFLTRSTAVLATLFVLLSIVLAALAVDVTSGREIDTSLERGGQAPAIPAPVDPLAGAVTPGSAAAPAAGAVAPAAPAAQASPAPADDPLAGAAAQ